MKAPLRTITPQGSGTATLRFDASLSYKPGQAIKIQVPGDEKPRYFSISSSPTETGFVEITVKNEPTHPLTLAINQLKRGDLVEIEGPLGSFNLPTPIATPLCFVAAGSGVTPFRSMIKYLLDTDTPAESWLLHSVKSQSELLFMEEFREWSGGNPRFHYVPTITRDFDDDWKNETGRINETLIRKHLPAKPCCYLLCGPPAFVKDMETLLKEKLAIPAENIRREQW